MKSFIPKLIEQWRFVYREAVTFAHIIAIWKAPSKDDSVIVRSLNRAADRAVVEFVLWALRAVFAAGVIAYLVWMDAPPEALEKILEMLRD